MYKLNVCFYVVLRFVLHLWNVFFIRYSHVDVLASGYKKAGPGRRSTQPAGTPTRKQLSNETSPEPRLIPTRSRLMSKLLVTVKQKIKRC